MARSRNIKPAFFVNDELADIDPLGRLLFIGMWTIADYNGNFVWREKRIKAQLLPYDECDMRKLAINLDRSGFIRFYSDKEEIYCNIVKFKEHQNPHKNERDKESKIPIYSEDMRQLTDYKILTINHDQITNDPEQIGSDPADSLNPITDSLNLDSLNMDSIGNDEPVSSLSIVNDKPVNNLTESAPILVTPEKKIPKRKRLPGCSKVVQEEILRLYRKYLPMCRQARKWTLKNERELKARWDDTPELQNTGEWARLFQWIYLHNDFLMGRTHKDDDERRPFKFSMSWFVIEGNFAKVANEVYSSEPWPFK